MKKVLLTSVILCATAMAYAGGLMTNTNYHIAFDRMMARGATFEIDAAYSNPAGFAWGHEKLATLTEFPETMAEP